MNMGLDMYLRKRNNIGNEITVSVAAEDETKALKIASDMRAEFLAREYNL